MMRNAVAFSKSRLRRSDIEAAIELRGVACNDFAVKSLRERKRLVQIFPMPWGRQSRRAAKRKRRDSSKQDMPSAEKKDEETIAASKMLRELVGVKVSLLIQNLRR